MILTKSKIDTVDLEQRIDDIVKNGQLNKLLLIVPTNRKMRSLKERNNFSFSGEGSR